jgi:hypothetical protein
VRDTFFADPDRTSPCVQLNVQLNKLDNNPAVFANYLRCSCPLSDVEMICCYGGLIRFAICRMSVEIHNYADPVHSSGTADLLIARLSDLLIARLRGRLSIAHTLAYMSR